MTMEIGLGTYVTYNPLAVSLETRVEDLLQMVESLAMHHFPVVDGDQRLVGVVSETDLILEARNRMTRKEDGANGDSATVKDIFTGHLVTVDNLASPKQALTLLMDHYIRSLPVLADGKLVGIVTETDFLREFSYGQMTCAKEPVSDFLEPAAEPLDPDVTADEALAALKSTGADYLAVVQGGCPIGVVSGREILKSIAMEGSHQNLTGKSSILKFLNKTPAFRPGQRMNEAAALMVEHGLSALAVTNQANRFLGIITADQILKVMLRGLKD
jgi:CBS domain-containing protein